MSEENERWTQHHHVTVHLAAWQNAMTSNLRNNATLAANHHLVRYIARWMPEGYHMRKQKLGLKYAASLLFNAIWKHPSLEDCPLCMMPLPLDLTKSTVMTCYGKVRWIGCCFAYHKLEKILSILGPKTGTYQRRMERRKI